MPGLFHKTTSTIRHVNHNFHSKVNSVWSVEFVVFKYAFLFLSFFLLKEKLHGSKIPKGYSVDKDVISQISHIKNGICYKVNRFYFPKLVSLVAVCLLLSSESSSHQLQGILTLRMSSGWCELPNPPVVLILLCAPVVGTELAKVLLKLLQVQSATTLALKRLTWPAWPRTITDIQYIHICVFSRREYDRI